MRRIAFVFCVFLILLSGLPLLKEPYYHRRKVCFWIWLKRELIELFKGEKA